ncbi:ABC transporter substrate-binding protein [Bradyrhizobium sp. KB893862 SZCCT0404]|uniref:ABC transporter substrate-binding protein n=1 Tax=Bradyrhizobium sp. KB893862 SZCCT0404 TaxID=2807672 RepID=UPI001BA7BE87|nr:ABC transporter substrate-binding protein [Bradyrhizobium sp. KB893862 SZCCT0404]MBR1177195.1 ABC transporter substrate-binding protein [Bradyrhizobium sp. KB893862 SZCCT0404]
MKRLLVATLALLTVSVGAQAQTLRFGFNEDVDILDPTLSRGFTTRMIFGALCDKLIDITPDLKFVPQLATSWSWSDDNLSLIIKLRPNVVFHDGEPFNAEAVKYSIERHQSMQGSQRKAELGPLKSVEVVDDLTVRLNLASAFTPLVGYLSDRAGMMVSPKAARELGDKFTTAPVCAGPFKFRERVAQDRIVVDKFDKYWNKDNIHLDQVVFKTLPDATVRLANLRSGQLDLIERIAPIDVAGVKSDNRFAVEESTELGWNGILYNIGAGDKAKGPMGVDPRIREAFELSIDRDGLVQAMSKGQYTPGNQWIAPSNAFYVKDIPIPKRDVTRAKALLAETGQPHPVVTLVTPTQTETVQFAQIIQAMTRDAGFDVKIQATEFATALDMTQKGDFEMFTYFWSGRTDPDGNIYNFTACNAPLNIGKYCNPDVDAALQAARRASEPQARREAWARAASIILKDRPMLFAFHRKYFWGRKAEMKNFVAYPDGLVRFANLRMN